MKTKKTNVSIFKKDGIKELSEVVVSMLEFLVPLNAKVIRYSTELLIENETWLIYSLEINYEEEQDE